MDKKTPTPTKVPATWGTDPNKLIELLSSFSSLRSNNRLLVDQIRGSIGELRHLRETLRDKQVKLSLPVSDGKSRAHPLKERFGLTRREIEVAKLLAQGQSNQAIARELNISAHTARHHTQRILAKLEVHSRGEAGAKIRSCAAAVLTVL